MTDPTPAPPAAGEPDPERPETWPTEPPKTRGWYFVQWIAGVPPSPIEIHLNDEGAPGYYDDDGDWQPPRDGLRFFPTPITPSALARRAPAADAPDGEAEPRDRDGELLKAAEGILGVVAAEPRAAPLDAETLESVDFVLKFLRKHLAARIRLLSRPAGDEARGLMAEAAEKAVLDEPEYPGDMPDEMWAALKGDRDACVKAMRATVRLTKRGILARLRAASAREAQP